MWLTHTEYVRTSYASMRLDASQAADFIKVLRPTLDKNNMTNVGIACCDAEGWNSQSSFMDGLRITGAEAMMAATTAHSHRSLPNIPMNTTIISWQTEAADLQGSWTTLWAEKGTAGEGMTWASNIYTAVTSGNASAYLYWIGAEAGDTNSKIIRIVNNTVTPSKRLWAMANWSRGVRPGAIRVDSSASGLKTSGFQNTDGTLAVQVINENEEANINIGIAGNDFTAGSVKAWITDNSHDCDPLPATLVDGKVVALVPSRGMVTFLVTPAGPAGVACAADS
jgi:hypothetical protein